MSSAHRNDGPGGFRGRRALRTPRQLPRRLAGLSLRTRVLVIAVGLLAVGLLVGNTVVIGALQRYLVDRVDSQLRTAADIMSRAPGGLPFETAEAADPPLFSGSALLGNPYVAYLAANGAINREMHTLQQPGTPDPQLPQLDSAAVAARGGRAFTMPSEDGSGHWRVIALPRTPGGLLGAGPVTPGESVVVAVSLNEVDATIGRLQAVCLATGGSLLVVLTGAGWFALHAGLRPLRRIEETSAAIARGDLSRRVPEVASPGTEVGRVSAALNSMLAQNEAAFAARADSEARMRRFVADASHELRTPLAGIKGFTKLYRMGAMPGRGDVDHAMTRIEKESERLTRLVEDLLLLAQLDEHQRAAVDAAPASGAFPLQLTPMDLRTLAVDALHDVRALDPSRPVTLTGPGGGQPTAAPTLADEARLRQVVTNLVGNAIAHTPSGTPVRIGVGMRSGSAVLEVADKGPGVTKEQAARIFDRFYRADASRSRTGGSGAGLGLAIVQSLVAAHGGRVELRTAPGKGATFRLLLPPSPTPPRHPEDR
jgi:two-component system OmpR family sensor kinase